MLIAIQTETLIIPEESQKNVTGTTYGTKRLLDVNILADILQMSELLIKGTLPEVNWDRIYRTTVSSSAVTLTFVYLGAIQFYIEATSLPTDFDISLTATQNLTLEAGLDRLLLESGDLLLKESA